MNEKRTEQRPCPSCGIMTDFVITPGLRGAEIVQIKGTTHKAPCGKVCAESKDATIADAFAGRVHHRRNCECLKEGRGYPRQGEAS